MKSKLKETLKVLKPDAQQLTIKNVILKNQLNEESKNEIEKIKETKKMVNREDLIFETNKHTIFNNLK